MSFLSINNETPPETNKGYVNVSSSIQCDSMHDDWWSFEFPLASQWAFDSNSSVERELLPTQSHDQTKDAKNQGDTPKKYSIHTSHLQITQYRGKSHISSPKKLVKGRHFSENFNYMKRNSDHNICHPPIESDDGNTNKSIESLPYHNRDEEVDLGTSWFEHNETLHQPRLSHSGATAMTDTQFPFPLHSDLFPAIMGQSYTKPFYQEPIDNELNDIWNDVYDVTYGNSELRSRQKDSNILCSATEISQTTTHQLEDSSSTTRAHIEPTPAPETENALKIRTVMHPPTNPKKTVSKTEDEPKIIVWMPSSQVMPQSTIKRPDSNRKKRERKIICRHANKMISRPFIEYCNVVRPMVRRMNPFVSNQELMKLIGSSWNDLSKSDKEIYKVAAKERSIGFVDETSDVPIVCKRKDPDYRVSH